MPDERAEPIVSEGLERLRAEYDKKGNEIECHPEPKALHKWRGDFILYKYEPMAGRLVWHKGNPKPFTSAVQILVIDHATSNLLLNRLRTILNEFIGVDFKRLFVDESVGDILTSAAEITRSEFRDIRKGDTPSPFDQIYSRLDPLAGVSSKAMPTWAQNPDKGFQPLGKAPEAKGTADSTWKAAVAVDLACLGPWYGIAADDLLDLLSLERLANTQTRGEVYALVAARAQHGRRYVAPLFANGFQGLLVGFAGRADGTKSKGVKTPNFKGIARVVDQVATAVAESWARQRLLASVEALRGAAERGTPQEIARGVHEAIHRLCAPVAGIEVSVEGTREGGIPSELTVHRISKDLNGYAVNFAIEPECVSEVSNLAALCLVHRIEAVFALAGRADRTKPAFDEAHVSEFLKTNPQGAGNRLLGSLFVHVVAQNALNACRRGEPSFNLKNSSLLRHLKEMAASKGITEDRLPNTSKKVRLRDLLVSNRKVLGELEDLGITWDRSASPDNYIQSAYFNLSIP